ncbi:MAG: DUF4091 domain-containing protein [Kiritimatiellia bacterium]|jgi:hypothetical protein
MNLKSWVTDAHERLFPVGNTVRTEPLVLDAARGERLAFQAAVAFGADADAPEVVTIEAAAEAPGLDVRIRRVGFVPMAHHNTETPDDELDCLGHVPGYVPDPLFDETQAVLCRRETVAFWLTVDVPADCPPGDHVVAVNLGALTTPEPTPLAPLHATIRVQNVQIQPRRGFPVVQWFYNDGILDWYGLKPFEEAFWTRVEPYMRNLVEHGQDTIYAPVFTPPLDGVKRPTQLLKVTRTGPDAYAFDWEDVKRYVDLAAACGIRNVEWTHLFTQWGAKHAIRIYDGQGVDGQLLWPPETTATSDTYRAFLAQFLPEFKAFLDREDLLDRSFFHVSDEPHGDEHRANYTAARELLRELAPWMKTLDALSEIEYGRQGLTDMPVPSISVTRQYREEGIPCFTYFCCGPRGRYLNRLMDTPLAKMRMLGWLCYRFEVLGFLHWGYNYWQRRAQVELIDPFTEQAAGAWPGWAYGDTFLVYPGPDGPIDSIRWEIFAESLQDYALLQTLGIRPDDPRLDVFVDFDQFPKQVGWLRAMRRELLEAAARNG